MNKQTIADIYAANERIHDKLKSTLADLSDEQIVFLPDGEKWNVALIVEHIALVKEGMSKISAKLLKQAEEAGKKSNGEAVLSENFVKKAGEARRQKFEAPERIQPNGNQSVSQSLAKMETSSQMLENLRPLFETVECSDYKFAHPFMGELSAHEWLALIGGHEARHLAQIERIIADQ